MKSRWKQIVEGYVPIDEWLGMPRTKVLRALRWHPDGITAQDLGDVLDLPVSNGGGRNVSQESERSLISTILGRLVKERRVIRNADAWPWTYRLAPGVTATPPAPPAWIPLAETDLGEGQHS